MPLTFEATHEAAQQFAEPRTYDNFINGKWIGGDSGERIELKNPTDQELLEYIQSGNAVDAKRAVDAAHAASPKRSRMYTGERQAVIAAIIKQLHDR